MHFQNSKAGEGIFFLSSGFGVIRRSISGASLTWTFLIQMWDSNVEIKTPKSDVKVRDPPIMVWLLHLFRWSSNFMNSHFLFSFHKCRCWIKVPSASNWGPLPVHIVPALVPVTSKTDYELWCFNFYSGPIFVLCFKW